MDPSRFDDLARSLNRPASRRRTLGVLLGSTLAGLGLGADAAKRKHRQHRDAKRRRVRASARKCNPTKSSNSACAQFCAAVFGTNTPEAGQCTSDAAKCLGLCYGCGPGSSGTQTLCGTVCTTLGTNTDCSACNDACTGGKTCYQGSCCTKKTCIQGTDCGTVDDTCGGEVACACPSGQCLTCAGNTCISTCGTNQGCANGACVCNSGFTACQTPDGLTCSEGSCCLDARGRCCGNGILDNNGNCCENGIRNRGGYCCFSGILTVNGICCCAGSTAGQTSCSTGEAPEQCL